MLGGVSGNKEMNRGGGGEPARDRGGGGEAERTRGGGENPKGSRKGGDERNRRNRAVGDDRDTVLATEDDENGGPAQSRASDGEDDLTPAAKCLTGVEEDSVRCCFGNRASERKP
ncbi:hypothetical protein Bca4012_101662 [Brassica carinata]